MGTEMSEAAEIALYLGVGVGSLLVLLAVAMIPYWIAKGRDHPQLAAIKATCYVSVILWPAWVVALIWAFVVPSDRR